jgi:hypothetical protein
LTFTFVRKNHFRIVQCGESKISEEVYRYYVYRYYENTWTLNHHNDYLKKKNILIISENMRLARLKIHVNFHENFGNEFNREIFRGEQI